MNTKGTYRCGHEGTANTYKQGKDGRETLEWIFNHNDCFECRKKAQNDLAQKRSNEIGLIELEGTEKQIVWATTIRQNNLEALEKYTQKDDREKYLKIINEANEKIKEGEITDENFEVTVMKIKGPISRSDQYRSFSNKKLKEFIMEENQASVIIDNRNNLSETRDLSTLLAIYKTIEMITELKEISEEAILKVEEQVKKEFRFRNPYLLKKCFRENKLDNLLNELKALE